jgi:tRNA dimethylallyltransferase
MTKKYLIVIGGTTAVGKTAMAIELAKAFETEIISADSRQFYKQMDIATAKPSTEELASAKHYFIDNQDFKSLYTVGDFEKEALIMLDHIFKTKDIAIMVGGSGLYLKTVCEGLDDFPEISEKTRNQVRDDYEKNGLFWLQNQVKDRDFEAFKDMDHHNPNRMLRVLEVCLESGLPYSSFKAQNNVKRPFETIEILLEMDRVELYRRINDRVDVMFENGLLNEAKALYPFRDYNALQTVGYQELFDYFDGRINLDRATELIKQHTRNFAKRQVTWFKKYGNWTAFSPTQLSEIIVFIENKIKHRNN